MSVLTKFKISWMLHSGLAKQFYCTKKILDSTPKEGLPKQQSTENRPHPTSTSDPYYCLKDALDKNSYSSMANARYIEHMYSKWVKNISSVDKSWDTFFNELSQDKKIITKEPKPEPIRPPPTLFEQSKLKPYNCLKIALKKDSNSSLANARYIELMFSLWAKDPNSVEKIWDDFFNELSQDKNILHIIQDKKIFQRKGRKRNSKLTIEKSSKRPSIKSKTFKGFLLKKFYMNSQEKNISKPNFEALKPSIDNASSTASLPDQSKSDAINIPKIQMDAVATNESPIGPSVDVNEDRKSKIRNSMEIVNRVKGIMGDNPVLEANVIQRKLRELEKTLMSKRYPTNNNN